MFILASEDLTNLSTLIKVYQINWLRARAKKFRWEEEVWLVPQEMSWTVNFFEKKAGEWLATAQLLCGETGINVGWAGHSSQKLFQ